jgi:hypothetical protein
MSRVVLARIGGLKVDQRHGREILALSGRRWIEMEIPEQAKRGEP